MGFDDLFNKEHCLKSGNVGASNTIGYIAGAAPSASRFGEYESMKKLSAGLLMFRKRDGIEFFLVHPGGPFWAKKDLGSWSIPKGEYEAGADPLAAAFREFEEEIGVPPQPKGELLALGEVRQAGGKVVTAWAFEGDCDEASIRSNTFSIEWPKGSGRLREFPEVDRAGWFGITEAREKILKAQADFLDRLSGIVNPLYERIIDPNLRP